LEILVAKAHFTFFPHLGLVQDVYCGLDIQADARPLCIIPSAYIPGQDENDTERSCMFKHLLE